MSMFCCMCEPVETAQSLGDDTYAVVRRSEGAQEHGLRTVSVVLGVGGMEA